MPQGIRARRSVRWNRHEEYIGGVPHCRARGSCVDVQVDAPASAAALKTEAWLARETRSVLPALHAAQTAAWIPQVLPLTRNNVVPEEKTLLACC